MAKDIEPISSLKRAAELVERVRERRAPIYITQNGKAVAVLQDVESYDEEREAFALLKLCIDGDKAIDDGEGLSFAEFKKRREASIRERKKRLDP